MSNQQAPASAQLISESISEILAQGTRGVLVTVVESGASPLAEAAKLVAHESGKRVGSLGEATVDGAVTKQAIAFLGSREEAKTFYVRDFAPELTVFAEARILFERIEAEPRLVIAGAGHVGASLARLGALLGFQVTLIDDRPEFVNREQFSAQSEQGIELVAADDWQASMRHAIDNGRGVSVAIVTRGHKQDEECLRATIEARPDYVGMIGSKRRTNIVLEKLREEGAPENELQKVRAPIGLDIGAVSPEEVALAILAEIVAERRSGSGAPLSSWRRA